MKLQVKKIIIVVSCSFAVTGLSSCNNSGANGNVLENQQAESLAVESQVPKQQSAANANQLITIAPIHDENKFDGWGTSLAWWGANHGGQKHNEVYAKLLYSMTDNINYTNFNHKDDIRKITHSLPGLGFNIIRYNLGGGDIDNPDVYYYSRIIDRNRWVNGFWLNKNNRNPNDWNWNNDSNQVNMLKLSYAEVKNSNETPIVEMFSNSPMWWMTANNSTQGVGVFNPVSRADDCIDMNNSAMLDDFGYYLAKSANYFQKNLGIKIDYIEPFNEPNNGWWAEKKLGASGFDILWSSSFWGSVFTMNHIGKDDQEKGMNFFQGTVLGSDNTQEGCNMWELDSKKRIINSLRKTLNDDNNNQMQIAAADYNQMNQFFREYPYLRGKIDKVNVHSYDGAGPYEGRSRRQIHDMVMGLKGDNGHSNMKLWQSEFGTWNDLPNYFFRTISSDLNELRANAWVIWQAIDPEWGLISEKVIPTYTWYKNKPIRISEKTKINEDEFSENIPFKPSELYFVMAQFSRHIRPDDYLVTSTFSPRDETPYGNGGVIAYGPKDGKNSTITTIKIVVDNQGTENNEWFYDYNLNEIISSLKIASSAQSITDIRIYDYQKDFDKVSYVNKANATILNEIKSSGKLSSSQLDLNKHHFYTLEIDVAKNNNLVNNHINRMVLHDKTEFGWCAMSAVNPFSRCDEKRFDYPINLSNWYAYIENNFYPTDWFPGQEKMTCPANDGYYVTGIAAGNGQKYLSSVMQCSQNSQVFPNHNSIKEERVTTEIKRTNPIYDWAYGMTKLQCSNGKALIGAISDLRTGILCAEPSVGPLSSTSCETRWFDNRNSTTIDYDKYPQEDFATYRYKVNVADDEYIAGIAYWGSKNQVGSVLVCKADANKTFTGYQLAVTSDNFNAFCPNPKARIVGLNNNGWYNGLCYGSYLYGDDDKYKVQPDTTTEVKNEGNVGAHNGGDWAVGTYKRECTLGYVVTGYSADGSTIKCAKIRELNDPSPKKTYCETAWFDYGNNGYDGNIPGVGDWAVGAYKGQVPATYYIAGIASGQGKIKGMLKCALW